MIDKRLHNDLENAANKILYVGDHGQLEPIGYDPGLMKDPQIRLERIHRQAENSHIIRFAHHLRQGYGVDCWVPSDDVRFEVPETFANFDAILCGYNKTRHKFNGYVRHHRGFKGPVPQVGETLICLQNNRNMGIFNGMQIVVERIKRYSSKSAGVTFTDALGFRRQVTIYLPQLGTSHQHFREEGMWDAYGYFDWGYALTVHKAQGSEWDNVCVVEEGMGSWDAARWRYTAVTRAAKNLTYMVAK